MALHKNLKMHPETPFPEIVKQSREESGLNELLARHATHIPKSFGIQHDEIVEKYMVFDDKSDTPDPYYGIWWLDDSESPLNLLALPDEFDFLKIKDPDTDKDTEYYRFSDIVETLHTHFPNAGINILDYSCSSCLYSDSRIVPNADNRLTRRLARGMAFPQSPKSKRKRTLGSPNKNSGGTRRRRKSRS
jgi:hypothetical protein